MKIWVVCVSHRHGTNLYAATTAALADRAIADHVLTWWEHEIGGEPPEDIEEAVEEYFEKVGDEWWDIDVVDLIEE